MKRNQQAFLATLVLTGIAQVTMAQIGVPQPQAEAKPVVSYIGDGLRIDVLKLNDDESLSGNIIRDGKSYPFSGKGQEDNTVTGTFVAGGQAFPFTCKPTEDETRIVFTTGKKSYNLLIVYPSGPLIDKPPATPAAPVAPNPLGGDPIAPTPPAPVPPAPTPVVPSTPVAPLPAPVAPPPVAPAPAPQAPPVQPPPANPLQELTPAPQTPANPLQQLPSVPPAAPAQAVPAQPAPVANPLQQLNPTAPTGAPVTNPLQQTGDTKAALPKLTLKRAQFQDITMGNVVSHTMLVPEGWKTEGYIEWSVGDLVYPQNKVTVTGPDKCGVSYVPTMNFGYTQMQQAGLMPPQGTPPPENFGEWLVSTIRKSNTKVSNVRLIEDKRDAKLEAFNAQMRQQAGINLQGAVEEVHNVVYAYESEGVTMRESLTASYMRLAPMINQNIRSDMWTVMISYIIRAPEDRYNQMKPILHAIAGSFIAEAKWWTQMQLALMEITRVRHEARMEAIRKRAEFYNQMTAQQHQTFKEKMATGDANQHNFLNMINETSDFQNPDGSTVNLPIHYPHVFTNGQGAYALTNSILDKPGELWVEIKPKTKP